MKTKIERGEVFFFFFFWAAQFCMTTWKDQTLKLYPLCFLNFNGHSGRSRPLVLVWIKQETAVLLGVCLCGVLMAWANLCWVVLWAHTRTRTQLFSARFETGASCESKLQSCCCPQVSGRFRCPQGAWLCNQKGCVRAAVFWNLSGVF